METKPGTRLGPYEFVSLLGEGGMGRVFRARDTKLNRDVAIKVLPPAFSQGRERVARFKREAHVVASLNHPNIAAIYGLEEHEGATALVLELVEGEDLSQQLHRGALPIDEALDIARQIAEGLEEAHERGIIHRDLKPANIKVTPGGRVKILDFGLAKALDTDPQSNSADGSQLANSPTMSRHMTEAGMIMGTAAYMSPEQARGKAVDKRADIWSFGVVLFEMLTGRRLFTGETSSDILAAVLTRDPDWTTLPPGVRPAIRSLLRQCLERDPRKRLHDIADARIALDDAASRAESGEAWNATAPAAAAPGANGRSRIAGLLVACLVLGFLGGAVWRARNTAPNAVEPTTRFEVRLPEGAGFLGDLALSPDGRRLLFSAADKDGGRALWLRALDSMEMKRVEGSQDARFPAWSPDGRRIAFFSGGELVVLDMLGKSRRTVAKAGPYADVRGLAWGGGNTLLYVPTYTGPLMQISADGGTPQPASGLDTSRNEGSHRVPQFLPDGRRFIFYSTIPSGTEPGEMCVGQLGSLDHRCLGGTDSGPRFLPPDLLLFNRGRALVAQRLDVTKMELVGDPVPLGVDLPANIGVSGARALTSEGGAVAYQTGSTSDSRLVWVDRQGRELGVIYDKNHFLFAPRLSPDGKMIAVSAYRELARGDVVLLDPSRDSQIRITRAGDNQMASWSRSGRTLAILTKPEGDAVISRAPLNESGNLEPWVTFKGAVTVDSWWPDDKGIMMDVFSAFERRTDIWMVANETGAVPKPFLETTADEHSAEVSPDGNWVAYVSDDGGREDVYVRPFQGSGLPFKVSSDGANDPRWNRDGSRLYFVAPGGRFYSVSTTLKPSFSAGPAEFVFAVRLDEGAARQYDFTADEKRFVVKVQKSSVNDPIVAVLGWRAEIERLLTAAGK
jgi:Tol biopolymer transport system component/tRNA A-37 threonylcarbamoyl transferase component Bud32